MSQDEPGELKSVLKKDVGKFLLEVKVTADNLKLFLDVEPHLTPVIERAEILSVLKDAFPMTDFDLSVIDEVCKLAAKGQPIRRRRIAKGSEAEPGTDGKLLILVKSYSGSGTPGIDSKGKFSLAALNLFDNVQVDQIIGRIYPPKPGKDGADVFGKPIKSTTGNPIKVTVDKTLQILAGPGEQSDEHKFDRIQAKAEGLVINQNGQLSIKEELEIKGDVDFHCGNIDFTGKVIIHGDVLPGFTVSGRKGILVKGNVQKGSLRSLNGDIEIKGFGIGSPDCQISCGGDLLANILHECNVEVAGKIVVTKEALECNLRAYKYISLPNGRLIGGKAYVIYGVEAKELGNDVGRSTIIEFCSAAEVSQEFTTLLRNIESHRKTMQLLELHIGPYVAQSSRIQLLKGQFKERMEQMLLKLRTVTASLKKLEEERQHILNTAAIDPQCRANAKVIVHPGVTFVARDNKTEFKDAIAGPISVIFDAEKQAFITEPVKDIACPDDGSKKKENKNGKK